MFKYFVLKSLVSIYLIFFYKILIENFMVPMYFNCTDLKIGTKENKALSSLMIIVK